MWVAIRNGKVNRVIGRKIFFTDFFIRYIMSQCFFCLAPCLVSNREETLITPGGNVIMVSVGRFNCQVCSSAQAGCWIFGDDYVMYSSFEPVLTEANSNEVRCNYIIFFRFLLV